ncbi:hypothetical protein KC320_g8844 [Hortaea werneckii]|nr:hypothetical protein KC320_g8844 [Hortaea werneckii]
MAKILSSATTTSALSSASRIRCSASTSRRSTASVLRRTFSPPPREWAHVVCPGISYGWEDVKFLQQHWDGPIILKGIRTLADAEKAIEVGVQGIVISNHGGRPRDGGPASLDRLPQIAQAIGERREIIFDSGVRCGLDIPKALALGAKMVLAGRPCVYGVAIAGESGVKHVLRSLLGDLTLTLHLSGIRGVSRSTLDTRVLKKLA